MYKRSIIKKTIEVGGYTLASRLLGIAREILFMNLFGIGAQSDAFLTAFKLPNFFRKIFAEGALSAAFVPAFVKIVHVKKTNLAHGLMSLSFLFFEGILLLLCGFVITFPHAIITLISPGFSKVQIAYTAPLLQILFPFIFFISSSALLAGALQSKNHFTIPALNQPLLNIFFIISLTICGWYNFGAQGLSIGILIGGAVQFMLHLTAYFAQGFSFGKITNEVVEAFKNVLHKFAASLLGTSVMEANLFIDTMIVSFLPEGSVSLLYLANRFMQIPIGIFAVAFSTVLLTHFSRIVIYAPKRMGFYLLEVFKLVSWLIIPATCFLIFHAHKIFYMFLPARSQGHLSAAAAVLIVYTAGLFFFCINKILTNIFYSYHDTKTPSLGFTIATISNLMGNIIGIYLCGIYGIAASTVFSGVIQTVYLVIALYRHHNITFYGKRFIHFFIRQLVQLSGGIMLYFFLHKLLFYALASTPWFTFFYHQTGYWVLSFTLFAGCMAALLFTRQLFGIKLYFISG